MVVASAESCAAVLVAYPCRTSFEPSAAVLAVCAQGGLSPEACVETITKVGDPMCALGGHDQHIFPITPSVSNAHSSPSSSLHRFLARYLFYSRMSHGMSGRWV